MYIVLPAIVIILERLNFGGVIFSNQKKVDLVNSVEIV